MNMNKKKINVAILFGGKSAEHEVSLQSAKNVLDAIDRDKYNPILIGIDKRGRWLLSDAPGLGQGGNSRILLNAHNPKLIKLNKSSNRVALAPQSEGKLANLSRPESRQTIDVVFPILHGPFGEDGTVQGLLKLADVPFVGAGVLGSAIGMDKDVMKRLLREAKIPIAQFLVFQNRKNLSFEKIAQYLGLPFFVKPANMGSSVGIHKVKAKADFRPAVNDAFQYDSKIIIEEFIEGREIECAVLGNDNPIASIPGEVIPTAEFYSYEAKYIDENGALLEIPAKLPLHLVKRVQALAIKTFKVLSCEGMGRVDCFLKKSGKVIVNEINTIPGFTSISMYPRLWGATGIGYTELIDRLIQLAMERFERERKLKTSY